MGNLFSTYIYEPILAALVFIYNNLAFGDLGIAIILLTVVIRFILLPVFYKSAKDQTLLQKLQPHIKKIQLDHKDDKEKQAKALLELYRTNRLNPFSGIALLIIQLPVFFALFKIFSQGVSLPVFDNTLFFGFINLAERSIGIALIAAILQYFQAKLTLPKGGGKKEQGMSQLASLGKTMTVVGPVITFVILFNLPSALGIYWVTSTVFSIVQQFFINKKINPDAKVPEEQPA